MIYTYSDLEYWYKDIAIYSVLYNINVSNHSTELIDNRDSKNFHSFFYHLISEKQ